MVRSEPTSTASRRQLLRAAGAAAGTVTLGSVGTAAVSAQQADPCDDVETQYVIVPEAEEDLEDSVDDSVEGERYCTVEETLAAFLGVEAGDQLRLWDRSLDADEAGSESLFTVGSVTEDRLARVRANADDLGAVGIDPRGVGKVSTDVSAPCFADDDADATDL